MHTPEMQLKVAAYRGPVCQRQLIFCQSWLPWWRVNNKGSYSFGKAPRFKNWEPCWLLKELTQSCIIPVYASYQPHWEEAYRFVHLVCTSIWKVFGTHNLNRWIVLKQKSSNLAGIIFSMVLHPVVTHQRDMSDAESWVTFLKYVLDP